MQVGMLITTSDLRPCWPSSGERGIRSYVKLSQQDKKQASSYVTEKFSGIMEKAMDPGVPPIDVVEKQMYEYVIDKCSIYERDEDKKKNPVVAGKTVYKDYVHIERHMPKLHKLLNFRLFDVRTLIDGAERWSRAFEFPPDRVKKGYPDAYFAAIADALPEGAAST